MNIITKFASNIEEFMPSLTYPGSWFKQPETAEIEFVYGIDKKNTGYIN